MSVVEFEIHVAVGGVLPPAERETATARQVADAKDSAPSRNRHRPETDPS